MSETVDLGSLEAVGSALGAAGCAAYSMTLVGNAAPVVNTYRARITDPQPGDLVVEASSFPMRDRKGYGHVAVGTLVERKIESLVFEEGGLEPQPYQEEAWYVAPIAGGDVVRWTNSEFIAIPRSQEQARQWRGSF